MTPSRDIEWRTTTNLFMWIAYKISVLKVDPDNINFFFFLLS